MKIVVTQSLKDVYGKEIPGDDKKPVLIRTVLINALLTNDDQKLKSTPEEKVRAYELAQEIAKQDEVEITGQDIVFMEKRLERMSTLVYAQVSKVLNQKDEPIPAKE